MRKLVACVLVLCLAACSQRALINRFSSPEEQQIAVETAQNLRSGNLIAVAKYAEPELQAELPRAAGEVKPILRQIQGPFTVEGVNVLSQNGGLVTKAFTLQAGSGSHWVLAEVVLRGAPGSLKLAGFHFLPSNVDPAKMNEFEIGQRGLLGYAWLVLMAACPITCITAVVLIWRRRWLNRRWLWTLGSMLGFAGFGLNWSNGAWAILFINISLLGAGAKKMGPYAPWILSFGVPVVAIIVIVRWFREKQNEPDIESPLQVATE